MDIIIPRLPVYVNQFLPTKYDESPSLYRCGTAAGAMCLDFAYPGHYDPYKVEHDLYVQLIGPDNPQDKNGITPPECLKMFSEYHVGIIDMMPLVQHGLDTGDYGPLHAEIEAQNRQGVIQFMSVADESLLIDARNGQSLHPNLHYGHCIVRLGFSDDQGYGLYFDPANPQACTNAQTHKYAPVPISWEESIIRARPDFCYAIMPPGVNPPPSGFSYQHGKWPAPPAPPKPVFDEDKAEQLLKAIVQECQNRETALAQFSQSNTAILKACSDLASDLALAKEP